MHLSVIFMFESLEKHTHMDTTALPFVIFVRPVMESQCFLLPR